MLNLAGSPGLVVMGDDSCSRGDVFESRHRILHAQSLWLSWKSGRFRFESSHWQTLLIFILTAIVEKMKIMKNEAGNGHQ